MIIEKSQYGSLQSEGAVVLQEKCDKASQLSSFKKALLLSMKDYALIFCVSLIVVIVLYSNFMKFFHGLSEEQLTAMIQKNFHGTFLENLKNFFLGQMALDEIYIRELWATAGWESVWHFLCLIPQMIFGILQILLPIIFVFHFLLHDTLKDMIQQEEKSLDACDPNKI
ncbi:hypothetical protein [Bartonella florencae]|uniref:hypothetical protein n=1 Tax=Bartonella florencae TaxID=928210 RepID=UPI00031FCAE4|nr:hypothetical protein [Bartonella florencae]